MNKKEKLTELIHELKASGCITKKEIDAMFRFKLHQLMIDSKKTSKAILEEAGFSQQNWDGNYKNNYSSLSIPQVEALAKALDYDALELYEIIKQDILTQKNK